MRANGLQGDASIDVIEIIDDDTDVFGDRAATTPMYDTGGPRWIGPAAALALVGIIVYGIATSASSSSVPKVAPAPSTTIPAPTTTQPPVPTTEAPKPLVPYYAADPPRALTVEYADTQIPDENFDGPGFYQLWATDDSSAASGSWFSVETYPGNESTVFAIDAYRTQTETQSIALAHLPGGQTTAQFTPSRSSTVNLTTFGMDDETVIRLADSIDVARGHVQFSDRPLIANYRMLSTVHPWYAVQGNPAALVHYSDANEPLAGFSIIVSPRSASTEGGSTLDRRTALQFFLDGAVEFEVDGHVATAGDVIGQERYSVATWIASDHIVTVSSRMWSVPELMTVASTVHTVSAEQWAGMQFQASRHNAPNNVHNFDQTDLVPVSFGADANAEPWTIQVAMATFGQQQRVTWQWSDREYGRFVDDGAKITTVVDNTRTYVLADMPRAGAPAAQLQITREGFEPVLVPFADTDPSFDRTFSAYAFSEPTTYTAEIIDANGAVLATWPSS